MPHSRAHCQVRCEISHTSGHAEQADLPGSLLPFPGQPLGNIRLQQEHNGSHSHSSQRQPQAIEPPPRLELEHISLQQPSQQQASIEPGGEACGQGQAQVQDTQQEEKD